MARMGLEGTARNVDMEAGEGEVVFHAAREDWVLGVVQ
jgi:hypothetical protein